MLSDVWEGMASFVFLIIILSHHICIAFYHTTTLDHVLLTFISPQRYIWPPSRLYVVCS